MRLALVLAMLAGQAGAQTADLPLTDMTPPALSDSDDPSGTPPIAQPPVLTDNVIPTPLTEATGTILTLDQDVLYLSSTWGQRAQARLDAEGEQVSAENERLTQLLSAEEQRLTGQRATLPAAEFRRLAEDFDLRATTIRRERAQAVQRLNEWAEADRAAFFRAALPVMGQVMQDRRAVAVLDRRTVFVSLDAIDVTAQLVTMLDQRIGDGNGVVPVPQQDDVSGQSGDPLSDQVE